MSSASAIDALDAEILDAGAPAPPEVLDRNDEPAWLNEASSILVL